MELKQIQVDKILANFYQPRVKFEKEGIKELAESILGNGLINPITVRKWKDNRFMIVAGERRWRAYKVAGLKTIQVFVKDYKDETSFMIESFVENLHREDLGYNEKARFAYKIWERMGKPMSEFNPKNPDFKAMGAAISVESGTISDWFGTLKLDKSVIKAIDVGKLGGYDASKYISKLPKEKQKQIAEEAIRRETGIGRSEVRERVREERPEPIQLEETINNTANELLSVLHRFDYLVDEMKKDNMEDLKKSMANKLMTTAGLHTKVFGEFVNLLRQRGAKPHPLILALMKAKKW